MTRRALPVAVVLLAVMVVTAAACSQDFDPEDRRLAAVDEYVLTDQTCEVRGGRAVATGTLVNAADEPQGFGVVVRFLDGDVDLGRPQNVDHPDLLAVGDNWAWEAGLPVEAAPADLRCNVIQVVIGDDVDR